MGTTANDVSEWPHARPNDQQRDERTEEPELDENEEPEVELEAKRRRPRRERCKLGAHADRSMRGGRRQCVTCHDEFPCARDCFHFDCLLAKGKALPEWVALTADEVAELAPAVIAEAFGREVAA